MQNVTALPSEAQGIGTHCARRPYYPKLEREFISRMVLYQACKYIHVKLTSDFHMHAAKYLLLYSFMYLFLCNCLLPDLNTLFEKKYCLKQGRKQLKIASSNP